MLDIPKLGLSLLNDAMHHVARELDDPDDLEDALETLETARKLVGRTRLKKALTETASSAADYLTREKEVMHALTEKQLVRRML